jgi:hypothetical protein
MMTYAKYFVKNINAFAEHLKKIFFIGGVFNKKTPHFLYNFDGNSTGIRALFIS